MKVLTIGTDRKLFEKNSPVLFRSSDYASKMEELHIIVFSLKKLGLEPKSIGNLHIYPTNSTSRLFFIVDAFRISKGLIENWKLKIENLHNVVISTQDPFETGLVGYLLKRKFNLPLQIQIHTDFLSPYFKNSFLNYIRVFIAEFLIPKADGLRVVSSIIFDSIKNRFPNLQSRVDILPVFIDIEEIMDRQLQHSKPEQVFEFNILMVSRFTEEKRIDLGLEVFKKILDEQKKDIGMLIIGSGPERENLLKKIDELNISDKVRILEWENDVISFYKTADIFLLTSKYEGYGMTLIEAGSAGCPIVTTRVGIAKSDLFKNGINSFVCPVGDINCLANSLIDLIKNTEKRQLFKGRMQDSIKSIMITKEEYKLKYTTILKDLLPK